MRSSTTVLIHDIRAVKRLRRQDRAAGGNTRRSSSGAKVQRDSINYFPPQASRGCALPALFPTWDLARHHAVEQIQADPLQEVRKVLAESFRGNEFVTDRSSAYLIDPAGNSRPSLSAGILAAASNRRCSMAR